MVIKTNYIFIKDNNYPQRLLIEGHNDIKRQSGKVGFREYKDGFWTRILLILRIAVQLKTTVTGEIYIINKGSLLGLLKENLKLHQKINLKKIDKCFALIIENLQSNTPPAIPIYKPKENNFHESEPVKDQHEVNENILLQQENLRKIQEQERIVQQQHAEEMKRVQEQEKVAQQLRAEELIKVQEQERIAQQQLAEEMRRVKEQERIIQQQRAEEMRRVHQEQKRAAQRQRIEEMQQALVQLIANTYDELDRTAKESGFTALHFITKSKLDTINEQKMLRQAIAAGLDINDQQNPHHLSPLHFALMDVMDLIVYLKDAEYSSCCNLNKKIELVFLKDLIDLGADIKAKDVDGNIPLHFAISNLELARFLIGKENNINELNLHGETPLSKALNNAIIHATYPEYKEVVQHLLDNGGDIQKADPDGKLLKKALENAIIHANYPEHKAIAQFLLDNGGDIQKADPDGKLLKKALENAIIHANYLEHKAIAQFLIINGALVDKADPENVLRNKLFAK